VQLLQRHLQQLQRPLPQKLHQLPWPLPRQLHQLQVLQQLEATGPGCLGLTKLVELELKQVHLLQNVQQLEAKLLEAELKEVAVEPREVQLVPPELREE